MTQEYQKKLKEKYPKIFTSDNVTSFSMYGIECGNGWYELLNQLCESIQFHVDHNVKKKFWANFKFIKKIFNIQDVSNQVEILQIKEKWGTLKFYYTGGDRYIKGLVAFAETMSATICEYCGTNRNVKERGINRIITLCNECNDKWENNNRTFDEIF
jgi:hypothetical protein